MIITYRTGGEPEHKIAISVRHIAYLTPKRDFTWVHLINGEKFLIDGQFEAHRDALIAMMEESNDDL